jgi:hypothetical protein
MHGTLIHVNWRDAYSRVGRFLMKQLFLKRVNLEYVNFYVKVPKTGEKRLRSLMA